MRIIDEPVDLSWAQPVEALGDLPGVVLYGVVLTLAHGAGKRAAQAVQEALAKVLGPAHARRGLLAWHLRWTSPLVAAAAVRPGQLTVKLGQRLKPARVRQLVQALAEVPQASRLRLQASIRRFDGAGPDLPALDG